MADKTNPNANFGNITSADFLPKFYQTTANKKFLQATVDQLIQPGTVKKINGYIGQENAKATSGDDIFIKAANSVRQQYQLEPGFIVTDELGNNNFFKDYQDYINQLGVFGGNTKDHSRLNQQEFYSWDPHIDWDKFVNFQNYYWLPYGPDAIEISGQQEKIESVYKVRLESQLSNNAYIFTPDGFERNPSLKLYKGQTYIFEIDSPSNPFVIKTHRSSGTLDKYLSDLLVYKTADEKITEAVESGTITFTVPFDCPDILFYVSTTDVNVGGVIYVTSIEENTSINVEEEVLGKKNYHLPAGFNLSNGMKVRFVGNVTPEKYKDTNWYVEGVGNEISLINEKDLDIVGKYTDIESVLFDSTPFDSLPFSDATTFAGQKDYIVINRASSDRNPWSRYNRWFHKDVVETSAKINGQNTANLDQDARAVRPIIEFEAGLKLFNFGLNSISNIDLIDTFTKDVFSNIEGQLGYNIDGVQIIEGHRILFVADEDILVNNKIYRVEFLTYEGERRIHLQEEVSPNINDVLVIDAGEINQGLAYWFNGTSWDLAQQKNTVNQPPLFDVFDNNLISFGDVTEYPGSTFIGTKIFSYKIGLGSNDLKLGFPLTYKNISNIGDIVFEFNLSWDTFQYKTDSNLVTQKIDVGYLYKKSNYSHNYINGWQTCKTTTTQAAIRIYKNSNITNNFKLDIFDNVDQLEDLIIKVYVNGVRLDGAKWSLITNNSFKEILLNEDIKTSDVLTIKAYTAQPVNNNGYYEVPINLQNNPLNEPVQLFTLGEVIDHVSSIENNVPFTGPLRDLGNITQYGTRFVQHSGPLSLAIYHLTNEKNNIVKAIELARDDYGKFKRQFILIADKFGEDIDIPSQVDKILQIMNKDKPKNSPYYFSDMVPFISCVSNEYEVIDSRIKTYPLINNFNLDTLSSRAVLVYINGTQKLARKDYTFNDQGFIVITSSINVGDKIKICEYENTSGCFMPPTPTKLGLWPAYEPKIYLDTSLVTPRVMIQGHDGSQILAYGDYRDVLLLELETRIFNNIKVTYDTSIFDIWDIVPGYNRKNNYSLEEYNNVLAPSFYKWSSLVNKDFTKPLSFDKTNSLTFNYKDNFSLNGTDVPGYWRGIYRWMLDTDRPNIAPWEMLGFSIQPTWWEDVYGPAPYTSDNLILWNDLADGIIRKPNSPAVSNKKFQRPFLKTNIPVNDQGNIISPATSGLVNGVIMPSIVDNFVFGDVSPVEAAWRRSSYYSFSVILAAILLQPAKTLGSCFDLSRTKRNLAGQLIYSDTGLRIAPSDLKIPNVYTSTERTQTAGLINYIIDYIVSDNLSLYNAYIYDLKNLQARLTHRIGGFTSKEKFNLLLDSKTPTSKGSVFIPQEDYSIILNSSSPIKKLSYSGVIITKLPIGFGTGFGFEVKGYSKTTPYFIYYPYTQPGSIVNVGGISEAFTTWSTNSRYAAGKIVSYNNNFFRSKVLHTTTDEFIPTFYEVLGSLPVVGGQTAYIRDTWDKTSPQTIPYGTTFYTIQEVVDFLLGYGEWLKDQGFVFDDFNTAMEAIANWETSAKEFLFWTTQNWSIGKDKWKEWKPNTFISVGSVVRYNSEYYRAIVDAQESTIFVEQNYVKLDYLTDLGSSVISLSPSANKISFKAELSIAEDIRNPFNPYEIVKVDGTPILPEFINSYRKENNMSYSSTNGDGIYGASFYLIQKEQVVVLNNSTMFNDTIYSTSSGYRQQRIKAAGYVSTNWQGSFDVPGFIFDQAYILPWEPWKDYVLGDIVRYKEFYYTAITSLPGAEIFDLESWTKLDKTPSPELLPNWNYKATQFTDFYNLDSDNFDISQQKVAQHLIGYQKRQYLENIIQDDVSEFKFYQGMIGEKGTNNALNKLFDVLSASNKESVDFFEEWALRVGQYGASQSFDSLEFILDERLFKNNPQGFELVNETNSNTFDFIIRQTPADVYLKPLGYNSKPWRLLTNNSSYLRSPGYVRPDSVKLLLRSIDDIVNEDVTSFVEGEHVWCGFEGASWNVYRYTETNLQVTNAVYKTDTKELIITTKTNVNLVPGTYIGINQTKKINGFYKINSVNKDSFTVSAIITPAPAKFEDQKSILIFKFDPQRISSIDLADEVTPAYPNAGEIIWTDDAGNGKWASWKYTPVYDENRIANISPAYNLQVGKQVAINSASTIAASSSLTGTVTVYDRPNLLSPWILRDDIDPPFISNQQLGVETSRYEGSVLSITSDARWLATGTPTASRVTTKYLGNWNQSTSYQVDDIVSFNNTFWKAIQTSSATQPSATGTKWDEIYYIPVNRSGNNSSLVGQGIISLYQKDSNNIFTLVDSIVSPEPSANENFGSTITFGNNCLFVGATGSDNSSGKVYQFNYETIVMASSPYNPSGSNGTRLKVSSTVGISADMLVSGIGFNKGQYVVLILDSTTLQLSDPPDQTPDGILNFTVTKWKYVGKKTAGSQAKIQFGKSIAISKDSSTLLISAPGTTTFLTNNTVDVNGIVFVYKNIGNNIYEQSQDPIVGADVKFGEGLAVSDTGEYIAISSVLFDGLKLDQGKVLVYKTTTSTTAVHASDLIPGRVYKINSAGSTNFINAGAFENKVGETFTATNNLVVAQGNLEVGKSYKISSIGTTDFTLIGAASNTLGLEFIATSTGTVGSRFLVNGKTYRIKTLGDTNWASVGAVSATFEASIINATMTVFSVASGTLQPEQGISGVGIVAGTYIINQLTGTPGQAGTYTVSINQPSLVSNTTVKSFAVGMTFQATGASSALATGTAVQGTGVVTTTGIVNQILYTQYQEILSKTPGVAEFFGSKISFLNDSESLVIFSPNATVKNIVTFDNNGTTFDDETTDFLYNKPNTGRVDVYDKYSEKWIFAESLTNKTQGSGYGHAIAVGYNTVLVGAPYEYDRFSFSGKVFTYQKLRNSYSWKILNSEGNKVDLTKIKQAFLYNSRSNKVITQLDVVDVVQGKLPKIANEEIKYKTFYDPAIYSSGLDNVNVDEGAAWTKEYVGQLWWDLRTAKFIDSYDKTDVVYRNSTWNTLFPGASVDVYEWVETTLTPDQWNAQADTDAGLSNGISGTSLYNNTTYSIVKRYDRISKSFKNTYYYWVKNKKTIPANKSRIISAIDVANLIANPRGAGYKFLALTSENSFSLVNVQPLLDNKDVILGIEYWNTENIDQNIHSQWKIISNTDRDVIPKNIEQKWFDSLSGKDLYGRPVPDPLLPPKLMFGIENRPRQGMFINRFEALKQFIETVNLTLAGYQLVGQKNLTSFDQYELEPSKETTGLYDDVKDTDAELRFASVGLFKKPVLIPVIEDGKITDVIIEEKGNGYLNPPYLQIFGTGQDASIRTIINSIGQVVDIDIINPGEGYTSNTILSIRNYSVLVHADSQAQGVWSIYSYDSDTLLWTRERSQSYDVRRFWNFIDWYALGYNQFTSVDYIVNSFSDLISLDTAVGQTVKLTSSSSDSTWLLLEKYTNSESVDWTQSYKVIGREKGTIQLSPALYNFENTVFGYDGSLYDGTVFDSAASKELQIMLESIKNNIFIDDLRSKYLELFFNSIRYAFSEQIYVDWAFKTSFVRAQHNVGELRQPVTYKNDNLENFEDYIDEVKPYRTIIREYISSYDSTDVVSSSVTDFDLIPASEDKQSRSIITEVVNGKILAKDNLINSYPWKFWLDNIGFVVTEIKVTSGGSEYKTEPTVRIISNSGTGASAKAFVANGQVTRVVVVENGAGYLSAPQIVIEGGTRGTVAKAIAVIGDSVVRSNKIQIKFDRITYNYFLNQLESVDTHTGTNTKFQFPLTWAPDVRINKSTVSIKLANTTEFNEVLRDTYKLSIVTSLVNGSTQYSGSITFNSAPPKNSTIKIEYLKDWSLLNAADRIQYYYNPLDGMPGKDLEQLMDGIDYGGVQILGLGFEIGQGWDSLPFFSDRWDSFDSEYDDYVTTISDINENTFILNYVPNAGTKLNVYHAKLVVDNVVSDGANLRYPYDALGRNQVVTILTPTTNQAIGILVNYVPTGSSGTTLKVSSTVGIEPNMTVIGDGFFSSQFVVEIIDNTTLKLSNGPNIQIGTNSRLYFTKNIAGRNIIHVQSTHGVEVGDTVIINPLVSNTIAFDTVVTNVLDSRRVEIDQILFRDIAPPSTDTTDPIPPLIYVNFSRTLTPGVDYVQGITSEIKLTEAAEVGSVVSISSLLAPIRIDAEDYDAIEGSPTNENAVMETVISTGEPDAPNSTKYSVEIPSDYVLSQGDKIIIRKDTSDGSINPQEGDYDTSLVGGQFAESSLISALGIAADEIIVDGDGFVTTTNSHAPEEIVPGQIVDAVAIKVYERPSSGSATIKVDNYLANGDQKEFALSQTPNSQEAVIVKLTKKIEVDGEITTISSIMNRIEDYDVLFNNRSVKFNVPPEAGNTVSLFSIGFSGTDILDIDYFVGDSNNIDFVTKASWVDQFVALVYINGIKADPRFFKTDDSYEEPNRIGIRFGVAPAQSDIINYILVANSEQTFALTKTERLQTDGSLVYDLSYQVGDSLPYESNMIVRVNQQILQGPSNSYFTIGSNRLNYSIDPAKFPPNSVSIQNIVVLADGKPLISNVDYTIDLSGITVKINRTTYAKYVKKDLTVSIKPDTGYVYIPATPTESPKISFSESYDESDIVEVISSYKHDVLDIKRTSIPVSPNLSLEPDTVEFYSYVGIAGGIVPLERAVNSSEYIWVINNGELLVPGSDYILNSDKKSLRLSSPPSSTDKVDIITYSSNIISTGVSYMQFKDMLNRVHYKRLSARKQTRLAADLKYTDTTITVEDASNLSIPNPAGNKPGIIEIRGERIEYFTINGTVLGQLRRGTLGTSTPKIHKQDAFVQDISSSETIPYSDTLISDSVVSSGTSSVTVDFSPAEFNSTWNYQGKPLTTEVINSIKNNVAEVFVSGMRLKKKNYLMYDKDLGPYSPAADRSYPAEFTINNLNSQILLTESPTYGDTVTVAKKIGVDWDGVTKVTNTESNISSFLKAEQGIWYNSIGKYPEGQSTFDNNTGTFDNDSITFDQG